MRPETLIRDWQFWGVLGLVALGLWIVQSDLGFVTKCQAITMIAVLLTPATLLGTKRPGEIWQPPSFWAVIYISVYVGSYLLANAFWLVYWGHIPAENNYVMAVKIYTLHFAILVAVVLGIHLWVVVWQSEGPPREPIDVMTFGWRPITLARWGYMRIQQGWRRLIPERCPEHDLQSKEILLILFLAELFAVLEYLECKIPEPYGVWTAKEHGTIRPEYSCQRALTPLAPYAAPVVTSCYLIWVNMRRWTRSKSR